MAVPTTLVEFWTARKAAAANTLSGARSELAAAQTEMNAQRANLAAANGQLAELLKQIAQIRADLAAAPTTADGEAFLTELAQAVADLRARQSGIVKTEAALALAQSAVELLSASVAAATADLAEASASFTGAEQSGQDRQKLKDALAAPPLDTLPADAAAALTAAPYTGAKARMEGDFPKALRDCARERAKVELGRAANDQSLVAETAKAIDAAATDLEKRTRALATAEAAWRDYVLNAKGRYDDAGAVLSRVADPHSSPLSEPEADAIQSRKPDGTTDAALQTSRNDAAAKAQAVATAQVNYDAKLAALEIARLKARAKDVDADPEADAGVIAAKTDAAGAKTTFDAANTAFTAQMQTDLASWEACVPDSAWQMLSDFDRAAEQLNDLTSDPAPLATAAAAETDLVTAMLTADKSSRTRAALEAAAARAAAVSRFDSGAESRRLVGAMRGDS